MIGVLIFDLVFCATILGISDGDVLVRAVEIFLSLAFWSMCWLLMRKVQYFEPT